MRKELRVLKEAAKTHVRLFEPVSTHPTRRWKRLDCERGPAIPRGYLWYLAKRSVQSPVCFPRVTPKVAPVVVRTVQSTERRRLIARTNNSYGMTSIGARDNTATYCRFPYSSGGVHPRDSSHCRPSRVCPVSPQGGSETTMLVVGDEPAQAPVAWVEPLRQRPIEFRYPKGNGILPWHGTVAPAV